MILIVILYDITFHGFHMQKYENLLAYAIFELFVFILRLESKRGPDRGVLTRDVIDGS
jgi:hypothetical protein